MGAVLLRPGRRRAGREYDLHKAVTTRLMALADQMGPQWRVSMMDKTEVVPARDRRAASRYGSFRWRTQHRQRDQFPAAHAGMGWSEIRSATPLERLTAQDWTYVQGVWDTLETPVARDIAACTGTCRPVPRRRSRREVVTPHGTFRAATSAGLATRPSNAGEKQANAAESVAQFMSQGYGRANTDRGATKARDREFRRPLMIEALTDHCRSSAHQLPGSGSARTSVFNDKERSRPRRCLPPLGLNSKPRPPMRCSTGHHTGCARILPSSRMGWTFSAQVFSQFAGFGPSSGIWSAGRP